MFWMIGSESEIRILIRTFTPTAFPKRQRLRINFARVSQKWDTIRCTLEHRTEIIRQGGEILWMQRVWMSHSIILKLRWKMRLIELRLGMMRRLLRLTHSTLEWTMRCISETIKHCPLRTFNSEQLKNILPRMKRRRRTSKHNRCRSNMLIVNGNRSNPSQWWESVKISNQSRRRKIPGRRHY